jgi:hypothetical protein
MFEGGISKGRRSFFITFDALEDEIFLELRKFAVVWRKGRRMLQ